MFTILIALVALMALGPALAVDHNARGQPVAGKHLVVSKGDYKVKTATNVRTGRLVIRDTTDKEIQVAGEAAANVIGVATYRIKDGEMLTASDFAATDVLKVEGGPGSVWPLELAVSMTIVKGDLICAAAAGRVRKWLVATDNASLIIGRATESVTTDGSTNKPIAVELLGI